MNDIPLVSVGIPTYNRASLLKRAVESVLIQDYANLELVISDNASTDETESMCREVMRQDSRIKYIRQPINLGASGNFEEVFRQSQGQIFMWLSDDDWLSQSYISQCAGALLHHSEYSLVCGKSRNYLNQEFNHEGIITNLLQDSGQKRVLSYYQNVLDNGVFYGLMRREQLQKVNRNQKVLGGDYFLIAAIAFMGKVKTLEEVHVNRSLGGASASLETLAAQLELPKFQIRHPFLSVAINAFKDIVWGSPAYNSMGAMARWAFACRVFTLICKKYGVVRRTIALRTRLGRIVKLVNRKMKSA